MNSQLRSRSLPLVSRQFHVGSVANNRPSPLVDSIIRVDHAGELGADRIYAGQMAILGNSKMGPIIQQMWDQEKEHKAAFEKLIVKHRVRPTAMLPLWNVAGFVLGAGTALMGEKAAMACTVAVEAVIVEHYNDQLRTLMDDSEKNKELMQTIQKFRDDEQEHHDHGLNHGAEQAPFYSVLTEVIKFGCKTAIAISKGLLSQRSQTNINTCRAYSTSTESSAKKSWDLYSAVCLERKPLILKPLTEFEQTVGRTFSEMELENSYKSDHEIHKEEDAARAAEFKSGKKIVDMDAALKQTAHEMEEISNKEYESFKPAPLTTPADQKNDVKALNRELSNHLLFLIHTQIGKEKHWILPQGLRKESETLRQTAERILRETCGNNLKAVFLGNAPCGFYKYSYTKEVRGETVGAKIFFFKALYLSGQVQLEGKTVSDYQWVVRRELNNLIRCEKYFRKVSMFLIDEDDQ